MKKNNKLYRLAASLTGSEKRYFKILSGSFQEKKENDYLVLFQLIIEHEIQNDQELRTVLQANQFKNLTLLKTYLYNKILESLRMYSNDQIDSIYKDILNIRQLLTKELFDDALHSLKVLRKKNKKLGVPYTELDNILYQFTIHSLNFQFNKDRDEKISSPLIELESFLTEQSIMVRYRILEMKVYELYSNVNQKGKSTESIFRELLKNPLLTDKSNLKSTLCFTLYFNIKSLIYSLLNEQEQLLQICKESFEFHLNFYKDNIATPLLESWDNFLDVLIDNGIEKEYLKYINYFEQKEISPSIKKIYIFYRFGNLLKYCSRNRSISTFTNMDLEQKVMYEIENNKMASFYQVNLLVLLAILFFRIKKFDKSNRIIEQLVEKNGLETRSNLEFSIAVLYFLNKIETKEYQLCYHKLVTYQKRFKLKRPEGKSMNIILNQLKRLTTMYIDNVHLNKMESILEKIKKAIEGEVYSQYAILYKELYLLEWVEEQVA